MICFKKQELGLKLYMTGMRLFSFCIIRMRPSKSDRGKCIAAKPYARSHSAHLKPVPQEGTVLK